MNRHAITCFTPPYLLKKLLENQDRSIREAALSTMLATARLHGARAARASFGMVTSAPASGRRTISDCRQSAFLPSAFVARTENGPTSADESVNNAFDGLGTTRDFYKEVLGRNSLDGRGNRLDGFVHYQNGYNNAFWDGQQMVFGDGDGRIFTDFTGSLDVIAHELTHGVTEFTANLMYHVQPGALNESMSDVFGSLVKQWSLGQSADEADWLIGADIFTPNMEADALRSMKSPGTAYDNSLLGKDPQPDHMDRFVVLPDDDDNDFGGVHINSGIPNKAFYLTAVGIGGNAWDAPAHVWYESLRASSENTGFQDFANTTYLKAGQLYGIGEQQAVANGWREVGIRITGLSVSAKNERQNSSNGDALAALATQIEKLASHVKTIAKDVKELKGKS